MSQLSRDDVLKLARLARLRLTDDEVSRYQKELTSILEYVQQLEGIDLNAYEPTSQVTGLTNVMRPDEKQMQADQSELLKNLPDRQDDYIKVKRMLG